MPKAKKPTEVYITRDEPGCEYEIWPRKPMWKDDWGHWDAGPTKQYGVAICVKWFERISNIRLEGGKKSIVRAAVTIEALDV